MNPPSSHLPMLDRNQAIEQFSAAVSKATAMAYTVEHGANFIVPFVWKRLERDMQSISGSPQSITLSYADVEALESSVRKEIDEIPLRTGRMEKRGGEALAADIHKSLALQGMLNALDLAFDAGVLNTLDPVKQRINPR